MHRFSLLRMWKTTNADSGPKKSPLGLISWSHDIGFFWELGKVENLLILKFPYMLIKPSFHATLTLKWPCYTRSGGRHYGGNHQALNFINGTLVRKPFWFLATYFGRENSTSLSSLPSVVLIGRFIPARYSAERTWLCRRKRRNLRWQTN